MKTSLSDLNEYLFGQIERLTEDDITVEKLQKEIERTDSIVLVSKEILANAKLLLDAHVKFDDFVNPKELPKRLT